MKVQEHKIINFKYDVLLALFTDTLQNRQFNFHHIDPQAFLELLILPCSCRTFETSARCKRWPLDPDPSARRTAWTRAGWAALRDTPSWTSCTKGASPPPAGHPQCFLLSFPFSLDGWNRQTSTSQLVYCEAEVIPVHSHTTPGPLGWEWQPARAFCSLLCSHTPHPPPCPPWV